MWPQRTVVTDGGYRARRVTTARAIRPRPGQPASSGRQALILAVASERLAFGLLASLLVFQLSERWGLAESRAAAWVGYFLAASYMTPLLGGLLCDRGLKSHTACLLGCLSIAIGYAALIVNHPIALLGGSLLVLCGSGLFRPGVQLLIDRLLQPAAGSPRRDNPQRDEAYAFMHAVVNVGGMLAPLCSEGLQRSFGWVTVSGLAVVCMLVSLLLIARGVTPPQSEASSDKPLAATHNATTQSTTDPTAEASVPRDTSSAPATHAAGAGAVSPPLSARALFALCVALVGFWMIYVQSSSTLLLWARDGIDRRIGSQAVPVSAFAALPWALVVLLTPPLMSLYRWLRRQGREPDLVAKLRVGFVALAAGFLLLAMSAPSPLRASLSGGSVGPAAMAWLIAALILITLGELCVAPLGPALFLQVAPPHLRGLSVSLWFGTLGVGLLAGGALAELWGQLPPATFFALACGLTLLALTQVPSAAERLLSLGKS